ncbi:MAG: nuclease, partial [Propionibacteriaceae bacterium]
MSRRFTLDAYAARSCPVKTQNTFHPGIALPALDEDLTEKFSGGQDYEAEILSAFCAAFTGTIADLRPLRQEPWQQQEAACHEAMSAGIEAIIGGALPLDLQGHRSGKADLWLRGPDTPAGTPGYYPVEVKSHQILERRQGYMASCSTLSQPFREDALAIPDTDIRFSSRELDLIQMAHYYRQLQAAGVAAGGEPFAAIIGRDRLGAASEPMLSWIALSERKLRTFSRSAADGWKLRAPLERYDHEHSFRVRVAQHALCQTGNPSDPALMVRPIAIRECGWCPWWEVCRPELGDDDLSIRIDKSPLDVREISVLRSLGISTVSELARADLEALLPTYLPETAHRHGSEGRLRLAHRRARLLEDGIELERITDGPITIPSASVEIDFDIETTAGDRVYLWGFLLTDRTANTQ